MKNLLKYHSINAALVLSALMFGVLGQLVMAQNQSAEDVLLEHLRVIVGDGAVLSDASVLLRGDTIVAVGQNAEMQIPEGTISAGKPCCLP